MKASSRLVWAVQTLAPGPDEHLLEVGCGHGVAVSLVCQRLRGGSITAIDRSQKMVDAALRRNAEHVASGRARLLVASLHEADLPAHAFGKVFALRVAAMWQQPHGELEVVRRLLAPGGSVHLFLDSPSWRGRGDAAAGAREVVQVLEAEGFDATAATAPGLACVIGRV